MSSNCREFRRLLERELSPDTPAELTTLSWHEHLLSCESCRELLREEEALEVLLASLPLPSLLLDCLLLAFGLSRFLSLIGDHSDRQTPGQYHGPEPSVQSPGPCFPAYDKT